MLRARTVLVPLTVAAVVSLSGCAKTKPNSETRLPGSSFAHPSAGGGIAANGNPWGPDGAPLPDGSAGGFDSTLAGSGFNSDLGTYDQNANTGGLDGAMQVADLEMVHFDYDNAEISTDWQGVLDSHAQWLKSNAAVNVQVEGHCDERGTEEYNIALGQRRADSVREYLIGRGVEPARISTISYGKLRPLTFDAGDEAHALNRRGMFLVYTPDSDTMTASAW